MIHATERKYFCKPVCGSKADELIRTFVTIREFLRDPDPKCPNCTDLLTQPPVTVQHYRDCIRWADRVYARPRFGVTDKVVRINKIDALWLVENELVTATAEELELYDGTFGHWMDEGQEPTMPEGDRWFVVG